MPAPILELVEIEVPTQSSGQSRILSDKSGNALLSWLEYEKNDTFKLQYARLLDNDTWSRPIIVAQGIDWFVNWADFPSVVMYPNGGLSAHWLQMRDIGAYDYDIHIAQSVDGFNWNSSFILHRDSIAAEHGFATIIPFNDDELIASWLDGRNTGVIESSFGDSFSNHDKDHGHGHDGGSMTLRTAIYNINGSIRDEYELDNRICDCCQTDMAMTDSGPVIVYRDRSNKEIRDISVVRRVNDSWTEPQSVYNDNWNINGCPVNGPAIDARGQNVIVVWYSGAHDTPKVQVAISTDGGASFSTPLHIDDGQPLGRVDVKWYNEHLALVTWLASSEKKGIIKSRFISINGKVYDSQELVQTNSGRRSGFPVIEKDKLGLLITWTSIENGTSKIRSARLL